MRSLLALCLLATAHFGKWHLSNDMIPDSPLPAVYGYDKYGAFNCAGEQMPVHEDADRAIALMEESGAAEKLFFINLWMHEPHTPFHTVPKYEWWFREMASREDQIEYRALPEGARPVVIRTDVEDCEITGDPPLVYDSDELDRERRNLRSRRKRGGDNRKPQVFFGEKRCSGFGRRGFGEAVRAVLAQRRGPLRLLAFRTWTLDH